MGLLGTLGTPWDISWDPPVSCLFFTKSDSILIQRYKKPFLAVKFLATLMTKNQRSTKGKLPEVGPKVEVSGHLLPKPVPKSGVRSSKPKLLFEAKATV